MSDQEHQARLEQELATLRQRVENLEVVNAGLLERIGGIEQALLKVSEAMNSLFHLLRQFQEEIDGEEDGER